MADQYDYPDETGWSIGGFVKKAAKGVSKAAKGAVKGVSKVPGVKAFTNQAGFISDVARGKNVIQSARKRGGGIVQDIRRSAPIAASVASFVPGAGTALGSGLNAAAALSQGKSPREIALAAAAGAVPGGALIRQGLSAGADIARGKNVLQTVGKAGLQYARSQVPGGQYVQSAISAGADIARGKNVVQSVGRQAVQLATREIGKQVAPMNFLPNRPSFGLPRGAQPEFIGRVARITNAAAQPILRQQVIARAPKAAFRPLSSVARRMLLRAVPYGEVAGLSDTGAQWLVESGDTGSKIALKLTGTAARWTELRAVNPKIMARSPELIKKYGFPIYVGDKVNLPASWIKVTNTTTSPTTAPTAVAPGGDLAALSQARTILIAWGKSDGANQAGVSDYGGAADLNSSTWSARDSLQGASFANWWNSRNGSPAVNGSGSWNDTLARALNVWAEKKTAAIATAAVSQSAPANVIPTINTVAPKVAAAVQQALGTQVPVTQSTVPAALPSATPSVSSATPATATPAQTQAAENAATAAQAATPVAPNTSTKWAIGSLLISTLGAAFVRNV